MKLKKLTNVNELYEGQLIYLKGGGMESGYYLIMKIEANGFNDVRIVFDRFCWQNELIPGPNLNYIFFHISSTSIFLMDYGNGN